MLCHYVKKIVKSTSLDIKTKILKNCADWRRLVYCMVDCKLMAAGSYLPRPIGIVQIKPKYSF